MFTELYIALSNLACSLHSLVGTEMRPEHHGSYTVEVERDEVNKPYTSFSPPSLPPSCHTHSLHDYVVMPHCLQVMDAAIFLCRILSREFIFAPVSLSQKLMLSKTACSNCIKKTINLIELWKWFKKMCGSHIH